MADAEKNTLTYDEAIGYLPDGEEIHTFMNPGGMLLGADWSRGEVLAALRDSPSVDITGDMAQSMKHGIAIIHDGDRVFIATDRRTDHAADTGDRE